MTFNELLLSTELLALAWIPSLVFSLGIAYFLNLIRVDLAELWTWSSILPMSSSDDHLFSPMWRL
ncbi:hypothetical protein P692DRAFT_20882534 [Suillus brevipes Sb2]|nr:hypothetical protein P692DRAFT_20882534 [Suillus brevipes Sb2]